MNNLASISAESFPDVRIENYLDRLDSALRGISSEEKQDILFEIRAHIVDSVAAAQNRDAAIDRVLRLLGSPQELAQRYNAERMLTRAGRSFSPLLLLHTTWHWAKLGMKGTVAFFVALFGYSIALGLTIAVILKPIMPSRVGLWWGNGDLNVGMVDHPGQMHELLGQWFVPVMVVVAFAFAVGTTQALRWLIRKRAALPSASPGSF
jgi:hypothetical protein